MGCVLCLIVCPSSLCVLLRGEPLSFMRRHSGWAHGSPSTVTNELMREGLGLQKWVQEKGVWLKWLYAEHTSVPTCSLQYSYGWRSPTVLWLLKMSRDDFVDMLLTFKLNLRRRDAGSLEWLPVASSCLWRRWGRGKRWTGDYPEFILHQLMASQVWTPRARTCLFFLASNLATLENSWGI